MSWITLATDNVETRLTKQELTSLLSAARQSDQTDAELMQNAIDAVTGEVRGYVAACRNNTLGATGTIPSELESAALALIRRHLFTRLPNMRSLYDDIRQQETEDAIQRLRDTAACKFAIVPPENAAADTDQAGGVPVKLVRSRKRIAKRSDLKGL